MRDKYKKRRVMGPKENSETEIENMKTETERH